MILSGESINSEKNGCQLVLEIEVFTNSVSATTISPEGCCEHAHDYVWFAIKNAMSRVSM